MSKNAVNNLLLTRLSLETYYMKTFIPALKFEKLTGFYDKIMHLTMPEKAFKNALIEQARIKSEDHILDFGCGTLTLSLMMKQQYPEAFITGIDVDEKVLVIADKKRADSGFEIRLDKYDGGFLPYLDETFDKVVSSLVFHHLSSNQKKLAIKEIYKVLKPNGEIHIADWGKPSNLLMEVLFFFLRLLDGFENTSVNRKGELPDYLKDYGFKYAAEGKKYDTLFGTLRLLKASK